MDKEHFDEVFKDSTQKLNDGQLEFFTYEHKLSMMFDKMHSGEAMKVYQGSTPVVIKFRKTPAKTAKDKFHRVYLNMDGEYFQIVMPIEMVISQAINYGGGKLKFLVNPQATLIDANEIIPRK